MRRRRRRSATPLTRRRPGLLAETRQEHWRQAALVRRAQRLAAVVSRADVGGAEALTPAARFKSWDDFGEPLGELPLLFCTARTVGDDPQRNDANSTTFEIVSRSKSLVLQAESRAELMSWMAVMQNAITQGAAARRSSRRSLTSPRDRQV